LRQPCCRRADYSAPFALTAGLPQLPLIVVFVIIMAICAVIRLSPTAGGTYLNVQPFLGTLGMQTRSSTASTSSIHGATPIGGLREELHGGVIRQSCSVYVSDLHRLAMGLIWYFMYNHTRYGKYMYAIGGNPAAAEVSGINVTKMLHPHLHERRPHVRLGRLPAGGSKPAAHPSTLGLGYELDAIAAATIGGVSTTGGIGTVPGVLLGVLVFELLKVAACSSSESNTSYHLHRAGPGHHRRRRPRYPQVSGEEITPDRTVFPLLRTAGPGGAELLCIEKEVPRMAQQPQSPSPLTAEQLAEREAALAAREAELDAAQRAFDAQRAAAAQGEAPKKTLFNNGDPLFVNPKEKMYDHFPLSVRQLDILIGVLCALIALFLVLGITHTSFFGLFGG
jgi:hypothetical protein